MAYQSLRGRVQVVYGLLASAATVAQGEGELGVRDALLAARDHVSVALDLVEERDLRRVSEARHDGVVRSHDEGE